MKIYTKDRTIKKMAHIIHKIIQGIVMFFLISCGNSTSAASMVQTVVANESYLHECRAINPEKAVEQVSYMGVTPGKTKDSELETILGTPDQKVTSSTAIDWIYGDTGVFIEKGIVKRIIISYVFIPAEEASSEFRLDQLIRNYGCPDILFAVNATEDQVGYTNTRFIYPTIGIEIDYAAFPASSTELPSNVVYFQPTNVQEYLGQFAAPFFVSNTSKLIEWDEAVE